MSKRRRSQGRFKNLPQFIAYIISGGAYFWSGYLWFFIADKGLHWSLFWATVSSNAVGISVNFLLQHFWVFGTHRSSEHVAKITGRYIFVTILNVLLSYVILRWLKLHGVTPYIGQFITAGLSTVWNWFFYKYWVFVHKGAAGNPLRSATRRA